MTTEFSSSVLAELQWRGFINDITSEAVDEALCDDRLTLYCGFDPTAQSLHVGNLVAIMALIHFQRHGHTPLALVGGATGQIGDPSGKDEERELLDEQTLHGNIEAIERQLHRISDRASGGPPRVDVQGEASSQAGTDDRGRFSTSTMDSRGEVVRESSRGIEVVNNAEWFDGVGFLDFLRDVGKCFSVNSMIGKESVRARLEQREQGISYTEFSYMLIQAFDFWHLYSERDCRLQIGGSDQWGNITAGTHLIGKKSDPDDPDAFGLTLPLITSAEGEKLGKTVDGAVFLDPDLTSPYDFYQYWVNVNDRDCSKLLRLFTLLPKEEIQRLEQRIEEGKNRGEVQRKLATEVTALIHGRDKAERVVRVSEILFSDKIEGLNDEELRVGLRDAPSTSFTWERLQSGELTIVDALAETGLQSSKSAARRLVKQGGAYLNNVRIEDKQRVLSEDDLASETMMVLRSGKRNKHILRFVDDIAPIAEE